MSYVLIASNALTADMVLTVVAETVVGASGVMPAPKGYFKAMKSVCKKYGALFILDEATCGMGRESAALCRHTSN